MNRVYLAFSVGPLGSYFEHSQAVIDLVPKTTALVM